MAQITNSPPSKPANPALARFGRLWPLSALIPPLGLLVSLWLWQVKKLRRSAKATLVLSVVLAVAYTLIYQSFNSADQYKYTYRTLDSVKIAMAAPNVPNVTVDIKKPPELQLVFSTEASQTRGYQHKLNGQPVANLFIQVSSFTGDYDKFFEPVMANALKQPSSSTDYKTLTQQFTDFAQPRFPANYTVTLGHAQILATSNIKDQAWQFDVTATAKTAPKNYQKWQGKILYFWAGQHIYYVFLGSIQQNWQSNTNTWQQMINSLQVS